MLNYRMTTTVALAAAATLLGACGGGGGNALKMMPEDIVIMAGADLSKARDTALWNGVKDIMKALAKDDAFEAEMDEAKDRFKDLTKAIGLNPIEDLQTATVGVMPPGSGAPEVVAIVTAKAAFDEKGILDYLEDELELELDDEDIDELTLYTVEDTEMAFSFFDEKTVVVGDVDLVEEMIDLKGGKGKSAANNERLAAAVKKVPGGAALWAAVAVDDDIAEELEDVPVKGLDDAIDMVISADLSKGIAVVVAIGFKKDGDAADVVEEMEDLAKDAKKVAKGMKDDLPFIKDLYEAHSIEAKGTDAIVKLTIEEDLLADIVKWGKKNGTDAFAMFVGGSGGGGMGGGGKRVRRPLVGGTGESGSDSLYDIADNIIGSELFNASSSGSFKDAVTDVLADLGDGVSAITKGTEHDLVFVVDTTGTMYGAIDALRELKRPIGEFLDKGNRIAVVNYKDKDSGDDFVARIETDFTGDMRDVLDAFDSLNASGGGDLPEGAYEGLVKAAELRWKARGKAVVLISDADSHVREPARGDAYDWFESSGAGLAVIKCGYF